jgi:hypothetical protein
MKVYVLQVKSPWEGVWTIHEICASEEIAKSMENLHRSCRSVGYYYDITEFDLVTEVSQ